MKNLPATLTALVLVILPAVTSPLLADNDVTATVGDFTVLPGEKLEFDKPHMSFYWGFEKGGWYNTNGGADYGKFLIHAWLFGNPGSDEPMESGVAAGWWHFQAANGARFSFLAGFAEREYERVIYESTPPPRPDQLTIQLKISERVVDYNPALVLRLETARGAYTSCVLTPNRLGIQAGIRFFGLKP